MDIFLFVAALIVICLVLCIIVGHGDSLGARMSNSLHRLLQWAEIESPSSKVQGKNREKQNDKNEPISIIKEELILALEQSRNKIENVVKENSRILQADFQQQLNQLHQVVVSQAREIESIRQLLIVEGNKVNKNNKILHNTTNCDASEPLSYPYLRYGKLVDSKMPLGFIDANLAESSQGCCFIITILSIDKATYRLADNMEMRQEALQMFHPIISTACEYDSEPVVINDVVNIEEGALHLLEGIWRIVKKNKVNLI